LGFERAIDRGERVPFRDVAEIGLVAARVGRVERADELPVEV